MALGCPVVVSTCAGLPSLCGEAALYAGPDHPEQWIKAFIALQHDAALRARLREAGQSRSARFSWHQSALQYLRVMAEVDGVPGVERLEPALSQQSNDNHRGRQRLS